MGRTDSIYTSLTTDIECPSRPYTLINMVSTIDGKIVSGERDEDVLDLGSKEDHQLMAKIEASCDAVMVGGNTLRATPSAWNPRTLFRIVVTQSGGFDRESKFLSNGQALIATSEKAVIVGAMEDQILRAGVDELDFGLLFTKLRGLGIRRLLVLGGSELNAEVLSRDLVDELFLTIAPKIKLGRDVPTYAGGDPLSREMVQGYTLVESHIVESEVFLRYRRTQKDTH